MAERAKAVQRDGAPELIAAVEQGKVSVSAAADVATKAASVIGKHQELLARHTKAPPQGWGGASQFLVALTAYAGRAAASMPVFPACAASRGRFERAL
jgi:hypothetical protein